MLHLEDEHRQVVSLARYLSETAPFPVYGIRRSNIFRLERISSKS